METKPTYETRALAVAPQLTLQTWSMIEAIGPAMHKARLFGVSNPEQAMAIMLKGYELGLSLTASFEFVQVIQGHVGLSPRGCLALIQQSPLCEALSIEDHTDDQGNPERCTVTMARGNFTYSVTVTMADAQRAGLVKPGSGWEKWPANMLRWRAVGFCADVVLPDVIGGMKRADELGANIDQGGDVVIDAEWMTTISPEIETVIVPVENKSSQVTNAFTTVKALLALWTPEQIMDANEGKIPATSEECLAVAEKLGASDE
jgi:hypothetical protein